MMPAENAMSLCASCRDAAGNCRGVRTDQIDRLVTCTGMLANYGITDITSGHDCSVPERHVDIARPALSQGEKAVPSVLRRRNGNPLGQESDVVYLVCSVILLCDADTDSCGINRHTAPQVHFNVAIAPMLGNQSPGSSILCADSGIFQCEGEGAFTTQVGPDTVCNSARRVDHRAGGCHACCDTGDADIHIPTA